MIRKYKDTDMEALLDVWFDASALAHSFLDAEFQKKEKENIRNIYIPNTETWIYEEHGNLLGFISMMGNEVGAIFIKTNSHKRGIGTKLMNTVAQIHPILEVEVFEKNMIGRAFYKKYGFEKINEYLHEQTNNQIFRLQFKS